MKLYSEYSSEKLPDVPAQLRKNISTAQRTASSHRDLMDQVEALSLIENNWINISDADLPSDLTIAAWNLERCIDVEGSAELLHKHSPDIVLLSEMDNGMARTGQRHTTRDLAALMQMGYAYCVEFHELGLGSGPELEFVKDEQNAHGWHGNAILSKVKPKRILQIRLDDHGHWFCASDDTDTNQPRIGGRVAVAAIIPTKAGDICAISTHLESAGSISIRQSQIDRIIAAVDSFAAGLPVIIGGDLNTGNNIPSHDWREETLFQAAERQGFSWEGNADGDTTRKSRLTRFPERTMKLDWFAHRGVAKMKSDIVPALDTEGTALSDHELIIAKVALV